MSEFYTEKLNNSSSVADRYRSCNIITDNSTGDILLSTREINPYPPKKTDTYHRLEIHELNRLDMLAYKYYKNPQLWWVIAQANDITNPFQEMNVGDLIRIPSLESLYSIKVIRR